MSSRKRTRENEELEVIDLVSDEKDDDDDGGKEPDPKDEGGKEPDPNDEGGEEPDSKNKGMVNEKPKFGVLVLVKDTESDDWTDIYFELRASANEELMFSRQSGEWPLRRLCVADPRHFSISNFGIEISKGKWIRKRLLTNYAPNGTYVRRMVGPNVSNTFLSVGKSELLHDADIISVADSHHVLEFMFFEKSPAGRKKQTGAASAS